MPGNKNKPEGDQVKFLDRYSWNTLMDKYRQASGRLFLLNYDGTLTPFFNLPSLARPDNLLLEILENIARNEKNSVYIISGRDRESLEKWLGHLPIGIIAENGMWIRYKNSRWEKESQSNIDRHAAVHKILGLEKQDFILAIGDGGSDEEMFRLLKGNKNASTIKVGTASSSAGYNLQTPQRVLSLLSNMILLEKQNGK